MCIRQRTKFTPTMIFSIHKSHNLVSFARKEKNSPRQQQQIFELASPWPRTFFLPSFGFCSWFSSPGPLLAFALESGSSCRYDEHVGCGFTTAKVILSRFTHVSFLSYFQPFEAVFGFVKQINSFLEKLITW